MTTDNAGLGYQVSIRFQVHDGFVGADCTVADGTTPLALDDVCMVPPGAQVAWVSANHGADLDVDIVLLG